MVANSATVGVTSRSTPRMRWYSSDHVMSSVATSYSKLPRWAMRWASARRSVPGLDGALLGPALGDVVGDD